MCEPNVSRARTRPGRDGGPRRLARRRREGLVLGLAVLAALVVPAIAAPLVPAIRRQSSTAPRRTYGRILTVTALACIVLIAVGLPIYVALASAALDLTLGRNEAVPFSVYPMFSSPSGTRSTSAWSTPPAIHSRPTRPSACHRARF